MQVPKYPKMKQSEKHFVAILWDMDDVLTPPDEETGRAVIAGLRKVRVWDCPHPVHQRQHFHTNEELQTQQKQHCSCHCMLAKRDKL